MEVRAYDGLPLYVGIAEWEAADTVVQTDPHRHPHPELCIGRGPATLTLDLSAEESNLDLMFFRHAP